MNVEFKDMIQQRVLPMTELNLKAMELVRRLQNHPELQHCIEEILDTAELANNLVETADDAEEAIVAQIRKTGSEALRLWAQNAQDKACREALDQPKTRPHQKKRSNGTLHSAPSQSKNKAF
jgi:hypothetical protein